MLSFYTDKCLAGGNRNQIANVGIFSNEFELENATGGLARYHHHVSKLFEEFSAPSYVLEFSKAALLSPGMEATLRLEILLQQFRAALGVSLFDDAYLALTRIPNKALQHSAVRELVTAMVEANEGGRLCSYPFVGLQDEVDTALEFKCQHIYDLTSAPPFHKVLYAWRIARGDYRGAATILHERLQRLQTANVGSKDPNSRVVTDAYLALINVLSCVDEDQAWVLSTRRTDAGEGTATGSIKRVRLDSGKFPHSYMYVEAVADLTLYNTGTQQRREVLTLADLKQGYQAEVERVGLLLNGGFFV